MQLHSLYCHPSGARTQYRSAWAVARCSWPQLSGSPLARLGLRLGVLSRCAPESESELGFAVSLLPGPWLSPPRASAGLSSPPVWFICQVVQAARAAGHPCRFPHVRVCGLLLLACRRALFTCPVLLVLLFALLALCWSPRSRSSCTAPHFGRPPLFCRTSSSPQPGAGRPSMEISPHRFGAPPLCGIDLPHQFDQLVGLSACGSPFIVAMYISLVVVGVLRRHKVSPVSRTWVFL